MIMELLVFTAAFFSVFLLGLNSKLMRDDKIVAGALVSWFITCSQYAMTWVVVHAELATVTYLLCAGAGGSIGITISQYFYKWLTKHKLHKQTGD
tara:strand:- start:73 stop:357 length:285 start_codon:yes stop_codon:yes gene_type:complete